MAEVIIEHVMKVYSGNVLAVNDANLRINDGQFVVLVGPSGCGKSTTLRMVAGLEEITDGTISIGDRVVNDVLPKDRDIAMVFQDYALYPHMDVYQNMAFGLKLRKYPRAEIDLRVNAAAKILNLEPYLRRKPKALSGGQRQRVAVGRAIVRQPKVFLFDEPLSNLDAKLRVEMRAELKKLHRQLQTTTIYVTHDQEEAMTLGDVVVVMKDGVIHQSGTPLDVYRKPVNKFVAGFLGTPPMNFLPGILKYSDNKYTFDADGQKLNIPEEYNSKLNNWKDKELILGVRPEAWSQSQEGRFAGIGNTMKMRLDVTEVLGEQMDLYMSTTIYPQLIARVETTSKFIPGDNVTMNIDMKRIHLFEPSETGRNLFHG